MNLDCWNGLMRRKYEKLQPANRKASMKYTLVCLSCFLLASCAGFAQKDSTSQKNSHPLAGKTVEPVDSKIVIGGGSDKTETEGSAQEEKRTPYSISITDISVKRELKDFFFSEEASAKAEVQATYRKSDGGTADRREDVEILSVEQEAGQDAVTTQVNSGGSNKMAGAEADRLLPTQNTEGKSEVGRLSASYDRKYSKKYGTQTKIEYGEMRGLSGAVRSVLIKAGYTVIQGKPAQSKPDEGDEFFDIARRIKAGDFGKAQYVLYGTLGEISPMSGREKIQGTDTYMLTSSMDIVVDYSVIDTKSMEVVASFTAHGSGSDNRMVSNDSTYTPSNAKIIRQIAASLAEEVASNLADQEFIKSSVPPAGEALRNPKRRLDDDSTTLKVYRK